MNIQSLTGSDDEVQSSDLFKHPTRNAVSSCLCSSAWRVSPWPVSPLTRPISLVLQGKNPAFVSQGFSLTRHIVKTAHNLFDITGRTLRNTTAVTATMSPPQQAQLRGSGTATPTGTHGSQTILQTNAGPSAPSGTLRLRAEPEERRGIRWAEDVVDNEGMGKKSSKVCCIYHKPHEPGDSDSDSSSSSSDSDSDDEPDLSRARKAGGSGRKGRDGPSHDHGDGDCSDKVKGKGKGKERKPSPNAYERQPKHKSKKEG